MGHRPNATAIPILPGKTEEWRAFVSELKGPKRKEFKNSLKRAGIKHEFVSFQHTPMGDFAVVADDGKDADKAFERLAMSKDPFNVWFMQKVAELHGTPNPPPPSNELVLDSCDL